LEEGALKEIFRLTKGYPYFLQEWGYQSWNRAAASAITLQIVQEASPIADGAHRPAGYPIVSWSVGRCPMSGKDPSVLLLEHHLKALRLPTNHHKCW
jgi:hypothetical protein